MDKDNKITFSLKTNDWIYITIILFLIQGIIWFLSQEFGSSKSALGYVSFAGTLISIILAVLAIGYTYGESIKQKNSSDALTDQIKSLSKIKDKIKIQADALDDIKLLKNHLTTFSQQVEDHFQVTNNKLSSFTEGFQNNAFKDSEKSDSNNDALDNSEKFDEEVILKRILGIKPAEYTKLILLIAVMFFENRNKYSGFATIMKFIEDMELTNLSETSKYSFFGGTFQLVGILNRLGYLHHLEDKISPNLLKYFNDFINNTDGKLEKSFNGSGEKIIKLAKESKYYSDKKNNDEL